MAPPASAGGPQFRDSLPAKRPQWTPGPKAANRFGAPLRKTITVEGQDQFRRRDSGQSAQWRSDFQHAFRTAFIALAPLAPGDWQWKMETTNHLCVVIRSARGGCIYSRAITGDMIRQAPYTAALLMADELRRWIEERGDAN